MRLVLPHERLLPFNEFGLAIANHDEEEWDIDIVDRLGRARLSGLETATYWPGDFPHFEVSQGSVDYIYDRDLNPVF